MFGTFLLAQMAQLQSLELKGHYLFPFPVMPRLRHLVIRLFPSPRAVDSIAALPALQTLLVEVVMPRALTADYVVMDLRACVSLQAVCFLGWVSNAIRVPTTAKLTLEITYTDLRHYELCNLADGLHLNGRAQLWCQVHDIKFSTLLDLSLHDVKYHGKVFIRLGDNAPHLRFLSVTSSSEYLFLVLSLPCLSTLLVHAEKRLELEIDDLETHAARFELVSIHWKLSHTLRTFEEALRAHCRKEISAGVLGDSNWLDPWPRNYVSTRRIGFSGGTRELHPIHPCTVASGACGACLEHCCPRAYPMPRP